MAILQARPTLRDIGVKTGFHYSTVSLALRDHPRIPDTTKLSPIEVEHPGPSVSGQPFLPYARNERLARPWALPGTPGLMHRVGGLEKQDITGNVNYEPENHQHMVNIRAAKVAGIVRDIPPLEVQGPQTGKLLVLSWGGTYGWSQ